MTKEMTGAEMVIEALADQGVKHVFGYPGGAVLPIYDAIFQQEKVQHILVRHEQGAVHMAEGYARSTGKVVTLEGLVLNYGLRNQSAFPPKQPDPLHRTVL